jgi:hypothetical protein
MSKRTSRRARGLMVKDIQQRLSDDNPPLDPDLENYLVSYTPRSIPSDVWEQIRPLVLSTMRRAKIRGQGNTFGKKVRLVSTFFAWAVQHGYPCDIDVLLTDAAIEEFVRRGCNHVTSGSRASYKSDLRSVLRAAGSELDQAHKLHRISSRSVKPPYFRQECDLLLATINYQPRQDNRQRLQACIALGLGAGIDSQDLLEVRAGDITDHGSEGIEIRVRGVAPRTVWLLHEYEDLLRVGISGMGPRTFVVSGKASVSRNAVNKLYSQVVHTGRRPPKFEQARMRNTWLLRLLEAPIPLGLVMQAAGLTTARTLADLVTYVRQEHHPITIPNTIKETNNHVHTT